MIVTNFVTLGLLLMTATGGALGGYLVKRSRNRQLKLPGRQIKARQLRP
jgi:hypothetical protein